MASPETWSKGYSRTLFAGRSDGAVASATGGSHASKASVPTDLCYGMRVGIRSCAEQRYVAAFQRQKNVASSGAGATGVTLDLEVSGYHPFRQSDALDRTADCPSEWVVLQHSYQQHRGPIHIGDEVCLVKELVATGERRKDRSLLYLALGPAPEGSAMEPTVERLETCTDLCKWKLLHADDPNYDGKLQAGTPLLIRGKGREYLSAGRPLWEAGLGGTGGFRSPARASGRSLVCQINDRLGSRSASNARPLPEMRFRLVRAGVSFCPEPWSLASTSSALQPPDDSNSREWEEFKSQPVQAQEKEFLEDLLFCLMGVEGRYIRKSLQAPAPRSAEQTPSLPEARFEILPPPGADVSIVQFLQQVLPLCEHHAAVQKFVEVHGQYEYGTVNHALCATIRELLKEFSIKVGQLETALRAGNLTIAKLWYHVQPSIDTLSLLHRVSTHVFHCVGGQVLNGIEGVMSKSSLTTAQDLCEHLLQQASRPYFEMVSKWVYEGRLDDPYGEFFITENPRARDERTGGPAADFWQKHFALEEHSVPQFLHESREKILHAGKYLHVFFSASPSAEPPQEKVSRELLRYSRRRKETIEVIDAAYRRASAALLGLFMSPRPEGLDLPGRLKSMRSFFFLAKVDWFGGFMDAAVEELEKRFETNAEVPLTRLEAHLDLAIRASSVAADPYRDDISCGMHGFKIEDACKRVSKGQSLPSEEPDEDAESVASGVARNAPSAARGPPAAAAGTSAGGRASAGAADQGTGISDDVGVKKFTLKYKTSWPLSIVFSKTLMLKYQVIFRHLLHCRHIERKLVDVWVDHQFTKDLGLDSRFSPAYCLRQRMLHFCREYIYYSSVEVLEPQSHRFLASLEQAESVDEVLRSHERFLDTCLRELLLTEREGLYKSLNKVLSTCDTWANSVHHTLRRLKGNAPDDRANQAPDSKEQRLAQHRQSQESYRHWSEGKDYANMISKFKNIFESQLHGFLRQIRQESTQNYEHFLSNMLTRLDYNDYYSSVLSGITLGGPPPESF